MRTCLYAVEILLQLMTVLIQALRSPLYHLLVLVLRLWLVVVGTTNIRLQLVRGRTSVVVLILRILLLHDVVVENVVAPC